MASSTHPFDAAWLALQQPTEKAQVSAISLLPASFAELHTHFSGHVTERWCLSGDRGPERRVQSSVSGDPATGGGDRDLGICNPCAAEPSATWMLEGLKPAEEADPYEFQITALQERGLRGRCPFTGVSVTSRHSFAVTRQVIFYRFETSEVYYVATAHIGDGFPRHAYYFPARDLLVKRDAEAWGVEPGHVALLKAFLVGHASDVVAYLRDTKEGACRAVMIGHPNFAHHLMNELSALQVLVTRGLLGLIDLLLVMREPLGQLEELFPELSAIGVVRVSGGGSSLEPIPVPTFEQLLRRRCFVMNIGARQVPESVVRRIRRVARRHTPVEKQRAIRSAHRRHAPLLWVSVRMHNRTLTDQRETLGALLKVLKRDYPRAGVVIDGFSIAADGEPLLKSNEKELLRQQQVLVETLREDMGSAGPELISTIGCPIWESVLWAGAVDAYLAHHGTLQHKVGWLGNKPGVVHSNPSVLASNNRWVFAIREQGVAPVYLAADLSRDMSGGQGAEYSRSYRIAWSDLYVALQGVLDLCMRDSRRRVSPSLEERYRRLAGSLKQAVRGVLRRLRVVG